MGVIEARKQVVFEIEYFVQSQIDSFIKSRQKPKFSFYRYLSSENVDKKTIEEFNNTTSLQEVYEEARSAYNREDPYLVEAYGHFKKSQLREFTEFLNSFIEDALKYSQEKEVKRTRKKRVLSPEKQVAKVKCADSCEVRGVTYQSVSPKELIGKRVAYIYDYKYSKICVYYSNGFAIKGTSIINFDADKSWSKKIRSSNEILNHILNSSQLGLKTLPDIIKTNQYPVTGRISENCIILKVF